ncbi:unnamed protein product [Caenorhabditis auriculariae]|uniref:Amidase domain-containing protein n=1 Tax=Caenorhabditis auriculariae TaxID=2777116 RepID=A0A8S1H742_9PELO|nr:unnamed protein product [Caenorhabditis auriculariae]
MQRIEAAIEKAVRYRANGILITETFDLARKQAEAALQNGQTPFPVVIKDCFALKDYPTTCSSMMLESFVPPYTSKVVEKLISRGACIIGKANHDEYSMGTSSVLGHFGPVKSALEDASKYDWLVPGGSSGGSAVAVQAGLADMALASDTGGSTRNPAAFNGVFGFKPTYGTLSRYGLANSLDSPSIIARSAEECWKYFEYMTGKEVDDSTSTDSTKYLGKSSIKGLVVGVPREYHNEKLSEDGWQVWNSSLNNLKKNGALIKGVTLPFTKYSSACYHVITTVDVASNMARYDGIAYGYRPSEESSTYAMYAESRSTALNTVVRKRIIAGNFLLLRRYRKEFYERALKVRRLIKNELDKALGEVDVLVTPTASGTAPMYSQLRQSSYSREDEDDYFTQAANLAGIPAISVPFVRDYSLPIGIQVMAARKCDKLACDQTAHMNTITGLYVSS